MLAEDYVLHHFTHFQLGNGGFWTVNLDSILVTIFLGILALTPMMVVITTAKTQPGFWQNLFELGFEFVLKEVKGIVPHYSDKVGPLALSLFLMIFLMNAMDLLPVDTGYLIAQFLGIHSEFKIVPTTDLNVTLALGLFTFVWINATLWSKGGMVNFFKGVISHPFGSQLFIANILFRIVEEVSRVFSLGMRLYGNMFAGEIIFILLAMAPLYIAIPSVLLWALFHILIIFLQAFIFMMLVVINFSLALDHD